MDFLGAGSTDISPVIDHTPEQPQTAVSLRPESAARTSVAITLRNGKVAGTESGRVEEATQQTRCGAAFAVKELAF